MTCGATPGSWPAKPGRSLGRAVGPSPRERRPPRRWRGASRMPRISTRFGSIARTERNGNISAESLEKISALARQVHQEGKSLRLWAIPDNPEAWEKLLNAGVDVLNTDKLQALNHFLSERHK